MLITLLAFAVTIMVIVAVHEYGHYLAMRLFGVRVLVFSVGFGPQLLTWKSKTGTKFVISAIPLGGYVRPLDRRDSELLPGQEQEEFSQKPAWQRVIVYAAGPAANFVLAILLYWVIFLGGQLGVPPTIGEVVEGTPAYAAGLQQGDEIIELAGKEVLTWQQVSMEMLRYVGDAGPLPLLVVNDEGQTREVSLDLSAWAKAPEAPVFDVLGIQPQPLAPVLGEVISGGAAAEAGLQPGDRILRANDQPITRWSEWVAVVQGSPDKPLALEVMRDQQRYQITLTPQLKVVNEERIGLAGVQLGGLKQINYGFLGAIEAGLVRTMDQITMILGSFKKMFSGQLSVKTLGGPITIAQAAGETASMGIDSFLLFLAFFSISLGVINLLPVPMLDGGWIVFGLIEMVRRKPLSDAFLMTAQKMGLAFVLALMSLAIFNDLMRQFS